jgi:hypothetical protein
MSNLFKVLVWLSIGLVSNVAVGAEDTIYTWQDERNDLVNYAGVPPDDQIGSNNLKVFIPEKGLTKEANLAVRTLPANEQNSLPPMITPPATVIGGSPSIVNKPMSNAQQDLLKAQQQAAQTVSAETANKPATPAPRLLSQGNNTQAVNPMVEAYEKQKISQQVDKLEEDAKSAQRIAEERRREEMKILAERVRNGAATKKEIATLITYRQTASFKDARAAMAQPKGKAVQKPQEFE